MSSSELLDCEPLCPFWLYRLLRVALLHRSCDLGDVACISNATAAIAEWMAVGGPRFVLACLAVGSGCTFLEI